MPTSRLLTQEQHMTDWQQEMTNIKMIWTSTGKSVNSHNIFKCIVYQSHLLTSIALRREKNFKWNSRTKCLLPCTLKTNLVISAIENEHNVIFYWNFMQKKWIKFHERKSITFGHLFWTLKWWNNKQKNSYLR